jgi:hypothetical protein
MCVPLSQDDAVLLEAGDMEEVRRALAAVLADQDPQLGPEARRAQVWAAPEPGLLLFFLVLLSNRCCVQGTEQGLTFTLMLCFFSMRPYPGLFPTHESTPILHPDVYFTSDFTPPPSPPTCTACRRYKPPGWLHGSVPPPLTPSHGAAASWLRRAVKARLC